jgi:hypothetical protein
MAIKVTGLIRNPISKQLLDSPVLVLVPKLNYKDTIDLEVQMVELYSSKFSIRGINKVDLTYDQNQLNHYNGLIDSLETYVVNYFSDSDCEFQKGYLLPVNIGIEPPDFE